MLGSSRNKRSSRSRDPEFGMLLFLLVLLVLLFPKLLKPF